MTRSLKNPSNFRIFGRYQTGKGGTYFVGMHDPMWFNSQTRSRAIHVAQKNDFENPMISACAFDNAHILNMPGTDVPANAPVPITFLHVGISCNTLSRASFGQSPPIHRCTQVPREDLYIYEAGDIIRATTDQYISSEAIEPMRRAAASAIAGAVLSYVVRMRLRGVHDRRCDVLSTLNNTIQNRRLRREFEERRRNCPRTLLDINMVREELKEWSRSELEKLKNADVIKGRLQVLADCIRRRGMVGVPRTSSLDYKPKYIRAGQTLVEVHNEQKQRLVGLYNKIAIEPPASVGARLNALKSALEEEDLDSDLHTLLSREVYMLERLHYRLSQMEGLRLRIRQKFLATVTCA